MDALLLEPYPLDVWLAVRSDGVSGSGTEADPYNATPRQEPTTPITVLSNAGREASATAAGHPYADGDVITVAGVTGPGAAQFNGSFPIYERTASTFKYWMNAVPGGAPQGTGWTASRMVFPFDQLMDTMEANRAVRLGPGVIQTRGEQYWKPKSGQKILGSGMGVTTLKLVYACTRNFLHRAIGIAFNEYVTDFEAADFTVDCNMQGQPPTKDYERARLACGAIGVRGDHIRIRRIRAINFGTQGVDLTLTDRSPECFVIGSGGAYVDGNPNPVDDVIEDCIVEQPAENNTFVTTCIIMGASEADYSGVMSYHRGCVIRNCHVNCEYANGMSSHKIHVASLTRDPGDLTLAVLRTDVPHHRTADDLVLVSGAQQNAYNGAFEIEDVLDASTLTYRMASDPGGNGTGYIFIGVNFQAYTADGGTGAVIEGNYARQVAKGVFHDTFSSKDLTVRNNVFTDVGMGVQEVIALQLRAKAGKSLNVEHLGVTATFTVKDFPAGHAHGLAKDDAVIIELANPAGFNGRWTIKSVPDQRSFTYEMPEYPGQDSATGPFTFKTLWQERHLVIEHNVIELKAAISWYGEPTGLWLTGGEFTSPYVFRQVVLRENIIRHSVGVADPPSIPASRGIILISAENAIIENNVIDVERAHPIVWRYIGGMRLFNNHTPAGRLLDAYNDITSEWWPDAAKEADDAFILALT